MKDLELLGDAQEEYAQVQVLEAMANESELGDADIEAWYDLWFDKQDLNNFILGDDA